MSRTGRKIALTLWFVNYYNTFVVGPNVQIIDVEYRLWHVQFCSRSPLL